MKKKNLHVHIQESDFGLSEGDIVLTQLSGHEAMSKLFSFTATYETEKDLNQLNLLGKVASFEIHSNNSSFGTKKINGIVTAVHLQHYHVPVGNESPIYTFEVDIHSWLKILDHSSDSRVFTDKTMLEIINAVITKDAYSGFIDPSFISFAGVSADLQNKKIPICVQYDESDCHFICRVLEENGCFFYFTFQDGKHILNVSDSGTNYIQDGNLKNQEPKRGSFEITFRTPNTFQAQTVSNSNYSAEFSSPINDTSQVAELLNPPSLKLEYYKHYETTLAPAAPKTPNDIARTILESSNNFYPGMTKNLNIGLAKILTVKNQADKILVVTDYSFSIGLKDVPKINFHCLDYATDFKSDYYSKPTMTGIYKAIVVGPVKQVTESKKNKVPLKFFWDRYNIPNLNDFENAFYTPVMMTWAGSNHGVHLLPMVGDEVYVNFAGGDPYEPVICGSTYTENNPSHIDKEQIPTSHMLYTVGKNSCHVEDKVGHEKIQIQAQKDYGVAAENDIMLYSKNNYTINVDQGEFVLKIINQSITISAKKQFNLSCDDIIIKSKTFSLNATESIRMNTKNFGVTSEATHMQASEALELRVKTPHPKSSNSDNQSHEDEMAEAKADLEKGTRLLLNTNNVLMNAEENIKIDAQVHAEVTAKDTKVHGTWNLLLSSYGKSILSGLMTTEIISLLTTEIISCALEVKSVTPVAYMPPMPWDFIGKMGDAAFDQTEEFVFGELFEFMANHNWISKEQAENYKERAIKIIAFTRLARSASSSVSGGLKGLGGSEFMKNIKNWKLSKIAAKSKVGNFTKNQIKKIDKYAEEMSEKSEDVEKGINKFITKSPSYAGKISQKIIDNPKSSLALGGLLGANAAMIGGGVTQIKGHNSEEENEENEKFEKRKIRENGYDPSKTPQKESSVETKKSKSASAPKATAIESAK